MQIAIIAVLALSLAFGLAQVFGVGLTCDTDLFMQQSLVMWRDPGAIFTRVIQINAPFNMMVYAPLAAFAARTGIPAVRVLHGFAFLMCLMSIASINHALKAHGVVRENRGVWCAAAAFLLLIVTPMFEVFADREHLLFAFALPWILQMLLRFKPLPYTAVLAAIGFCMRPHNAILFGVLTLIGGPKEWPFWKRIFSPSSFIIGSIMGLYVLSVLLFFPAYLTKMVPMASLIYTAGQVPMSRKEELGAPFILLMMAGLIMFIQRERFTWYAFFLTMVVIFLLNSGWDYTFMWLVAPLVIIYALPWCPPYRDDLKRGALVFSASILLLMFGLGSVYLQKQMAEMQAGGTSLHHHHLPARLTEDLRAAAEPGKQFILLSPMLWNIDIEPFNGDPKSVFGFDVLWPLFWLLHHTGDPHFPQVLHFATDPLLLALKEHPNAPVIVDLSPKLVVYGGDGKILEFLERDDRVKAAFAAYVPVQRIDYCVNGRTLNCRFEVWRRK